MQGIEVGKEVARKILQWRSTDGSDVPGTFSLPDDPGNWQPTGAPAAFVHAGSITPFAVESTSQFRPDPPPSLASAEYTAGFNEAKELGGATAHRVRRLKPTPPWPGGRPYPSRRRGSWISLRR